MFVVQHLNKPSKLRLVWDAVAEYKGVYLKILKGPDQVTPLVTILHQFKEHPIAVTGDIAEMIHQVEETENGQHS